MERTEQERPILDGASRIGIINRGEAAIRFIRAVREYNALHQTALTAVAFYLDIEQEAPFVKEADEACPLSKLTGFARVKGSAYLNKELMLEALLSAQCQAVWVGWGFLSEDAAFARMVEDSGLVFIGPSSESMALLGNKISAKELAQRARVPILPWSEGPVAGVEEARRVADRIGYPLIVKAANAGGGRGIRFIRKPEELAAQYQAAREESLRTAGNDIVFIEHQVVTGRHLEVQVLADRYGQVQTFGVRDCSVQRRNQKIIEETPPPHFDRQMIEDMEQAAARLIVEAGYESAGTVEFLYDEDQSQFYFMEVNTRLQVEHPITEQLYNVDLVKGQLRVASGQRLPELTEKEEDIYTPRGCAIEVRLNAEDPDREFIPAPGRIVLFKAPSGPGIRVDSGIEQGSAIPSEFDSMIAKIIAYAPCRSEALARLERALREMHIKIEGGTTNRAFLLGLLQCHGIRQGGVHTRFVEDLIKGKDQLPEGQGQDHQKQIIKRNTWNIALLACAIEQAISRYQEELIHFRQQWNSIGQPRDIPLSCGYEVTLQLQGHTYVFQVKALGGNIFHLKIDGQLLAVHYSKRNHEAIMHCGNKRYAIQMVSRDDVLQCEIDGIPYYVGIESNDQIKAPFPAVVISIAAAPGQAVQKGDVLLQLEAMKMLMSIEAPKSGKVKTISVREGEQVYSGQALVQMDTGEQSESEEESGQPRVSFDLQEIHDTARKWQILEREFLAVFFGFDYDEEEETAAAIFEKLIEFVRENPQLQKQIITCFLSALEAYAAIEILFSHKRIESEGFAGAASYQELLMHFFIRNECQKEGLPQEFLDSLERALVWYPQGGQSEKERFDQALFRIYKSHAHLATKQNLLRSMLCSMKEFPDIRIFSQRVSDLLDEIALISQNQLPVLADAAIQARYHLIDRMFLETIKEERKGQLERLVELTVRGDGNGDEDKKERSGLMDRIANTGHYMVFELLFLALDPVREKRALAMELLGKYFNRDRRILSAGMEEENGLLLCRVDSTKGRENYETFVIVSNDKTWAKDAGKIHRYLERAKMKEKPELIVLIAAEGGQEQEREERIIQHLYRQVFPVSWCCLGLFSSPFPKGAEERFSGNNACSYRTFTLDQEEKWREDFLRYSFNPLFYRELKIHLLSRFNLKILYSSESAYLISAVAQSNQNDRRLIALVDIPESRAEVGEDNSISRIVAFDHALTEAIYAMSVERSKADGSFYLNRIIVHIHPLLTVNMQQITAYAHKLTPRARELGLEKVIIHTRRRKENDDTIHEFELHFTNISQDHFAMDVCLPSTKLLEAMTDDYISRVVRARQRGNVYPYEIIKMITHLELGQSGDMNFIAGNFEEYDIQVNENRDTEGQETISVKARPYGRNKSNIVFGIITNFTRNYPRGLKRVIILVDTTRDMGSLAEPECRRVIGALDLAEQLRIPVEWLPLSAGAKIDMNSGTENLDWTARVLRAIIEFTQAGGEINMIVSGVNVGAQSYWNAEATMLMHTQGVLIMTEDASMLLTGKKALDFSGSVSAEDNIGIGGVERIMGPNGQAQMKAKNLSEAYEILFQHYDFTYREPGKVFPARQSSKDSPDRDITLSPYRDRLDQGFTCIGDIFSQKYNPERKKPFDMRQVMQAVIDQDLGFLERWQMMKNAETAIVWEARIGGFAAGMLGVESKPLARMGRIPHDGPESWTGGTLFPQSSKKLARAINAFSKRLPLVILANLSGFDGSPESLRKLQLEFGAEIGRAIVNFQGPIVFVVIARYHGGAYVVFSRTLNPFLKSAALEGAYASVIGGAPAAAVVFPRQVLKDTYADPRIREAQSRLDNDPEFRQNDFDDLFQKIHTEKQTALAQRFDQIHSVERAKKVGSIEDIVSSQDLRPYLIRSIEEGMRKFMASG
ncbi:MAG: carboxyl transferase domain-containing protein [bacterium]